MANENAVKLALGISLFGALIFYHLTEYFIGGTGVAHLFDLLKIAQLAVTAAFFAMTVYFPPMVRLVLGDKYIAGEFTGKAYHHEPRPGDEETTDIACSITQNLFGAHIEGYSKRDGKLVSTWNGPLHRVSEREFSFVLELNWKKTEYGVVKLLFSGKDVNGIYYGGDPGYPYPFAVSLVRLS